MDALHDETGYFLYKKMGYVKTEIQDNAG